MGCLDKLCEQKKFFQEFMKDKEPFRSTCKKPYLAIKCKDPKKCDCSPKKKSHFRKSRFPFPSRKRRTTLIQCLNQKQIRSPQCSLFTGHISNIQTSTLFGLKIKCSNGSQHHCQQSLNKTITSRKTFRISFATSITNLNHIKTYYIRL